MIKEILYERRVMSKELGLRINEAISKSKFTKAEVARRFGITAQAVNGWVKTGRISKELLVELANLIGANPNYLLFGYDTNSDEVGVGDKEVALFLNDGQRDLLKAIANLYGVSENEAAQIAMKKGIENYRNSKQKHGSLEKLSIDDLKESIAASSPRTTAMLNQMSQLIDEGIELSEQEESIIKSILDSVKKRHKE